MYNSLISRSEVDKENVIFIENTNAKLFFLMDSDKNVIKEVEDLLLDAYETRMSERITV
jgi:hypothetical protein